MKKILTNLFVTIYPLLLFLVIFFINPTARELQRGIWDYTGVIIRYCAFFLLVLIFVYISYIKKSDYHLASITVGLVISVLILIPDIIFLMPVDVWSHIFMDIQVYIVMYGTIITLYLGLLIIYFKK